MRGNGMIVRHGQLVHFWGDIDEKLDVKSVTKSMGGVVLGLAIKENKVALDRKGIEFIPTFGTPPAANAAGAQTITLAQLATHTAGFQKIDRTVNGEFTAVLEFTPGTTWSYSDAGLNWLADVLTTVNQQDLAAVAQDKVWSVLGVNPSGNTDDIFWRAAALRPPTRPSTGTLQYRELASGIQANVNAMARVGLLFLRKGKWKDAEILTTQFVTDVQTPRPENAGLALNETAPHYLFPGARTDYGVLWWTNKSGLMANVPKDAFWAWGLGEALIVVIPSLDLVIARNGGQSGAGATARADRVWNDERMGRQRQGARAVPESDRRGDDAVRTQAEGAGLSPRAFSVHNDFQSVLLRLQCIRHCFDRHARCTFTIRVVLALERQRAAVQLDLADAASLRAH